MALFGNATKTWIPEALIGVGIALVVPVILPAIAAGVRPLAKTILKGGFLLADTLHQLVTEARAEMAAAGSRGDSPGLEIAEGIIEEVVEGVAEAVTEEGVAEALTAAVEVL